MRENRGVAFPPPEKPEEGSEILAFAWRRKWLVVLSVVTALGLGYLYFLKQTPLYESSTKLLVVRHRPALPIRGVEVETVHDSTHATLLRSPIIIDQAIERNQLRSLPSLRGSGDLAHTIIAGLRVSSSGNRTGSDIISLSYQSGSRDDCPKVLNGIIDAYQNFLGETYQNVSLETLKLIEQAKDEVGLQAEQAEKDYREFRAEAPLLFSEGTGHNIHESRLVEIEEVRSSCLLDNSKLQANIDAIEASVKRGSRREVLNLLVKQFQNSQDNSKFANGSGSRLSQEQQLFPLLLEEQSLLENFGTSHPQVVAIRKRIAFTRKHLAGQSVGDDSKPSEPLDFYEVYLESLRGRIRMNDEINKAMSEYYETERDRAKSLSIYQVEDETFRGTIARKKKLFETIIARLEEVNLTQGVGGTTMQVIAQPGRAGQVAPNMNQILITSGILGLLSGLVLAFAVDAGDRRFRSPKDIRDDLGLPVVGHIPQFVVAKKSVRNSNGDQKITDTIEWELPTVHQSRGRIAEAYRAVRTALYFSTRGGGHKVIQITSPNPADGKSTIAANLAVTIANSGKQVLLVDADFRRPRIHTIFGLDEGEGGLSTVIDGSTEILDVVQAASVENLSVLCCGPRPKNPSELLTSVQFQKFLDVVREQYDFVIVDTPPMLVVTDPSVVAPRVDGVLLVMRLGKNSRASANQSLEALEAVGGHVLGVVVNAVGRGEGFGGNYNNYRYGGNGYGYGQTNSKSYSQSE
jgi:capsular exopolysaccharide synthesis family protein